MKLTIDTEKLKSANVTLQEALVMLAVSDGDYTSCFNGLKKKGILVTLGDSLSVSQQRLKLVNNAITRDAIDDARLTTLAEQVQQCFPKQKMRDKAGRETPFYYRCNRTEIKNKLRKFLERFSDYTDEDIVDATRRYVASFNGNYAGMRLAKYFIWKDDVRPSDDGANHVEAVSDLATFLENKNDDTVINISDDWMYNSKN